MIVGFAQKTKVEELENVQYIQDGIILEIKYRGWYLGRTVGSRFCSCNVALPNPNHYIFHAQAKKNHTKVQPQPG
jgi:hypothetical protein